LLILLFAVGAEQDGHEEADLGLLARLRCSSRPPQHVELLVHAAQLHVGVDHHRIVSLHHGIQEFVQADGLVAFVPVLEILRAPASGPR